MTDVGDTPYDLISTLLPHSTAPQLLEIEANSPHIAKYTNRCVFTFFCASKCKLTIVVSGRHLARLVRSRVYRGAEGGRGRADEEGGRADELAGAVCGGGG